jgi:ABC-2 type transport system permease protein
MLRNTLLIAKREYIERVRSKVFRITTILVPVGLGAVAFLGAMGGKHIEKTVSHLAIVSNSPALAQQIKASLESGKNKSDSVVVYAPGSAAIRTHLDQQVSSRSIGGYLVVDQTPGEAVPQATWISGSATDFIGQQVMSQAVTNGLVRQELQTRGVSDTEIQSLMDKVKLKTMQIKNGQVVASDASRSFAGAYALILVLYGSVLIYGINIARSVVEEKTSRVFEVLLSTASADELMLGKLLGVGATGMTQMGIWAALLVAFTGSQLAARAGIHGLASLGVTLPELIFFLIFFLLGFFLYSGMAAALGSSVSAEQEVQQFSFILISPLVVSVVLMMYVMSNPASTISVILSLIPPFTPIIMYMRICAQTPPWWQLALSVALLFASVLGMAWLAARIYRVGVLMYGKRATLPEIIRWLRYS